MMPRFRLASSTTLNSLQLAFNNMPVMRSASLPADKIHELFIVSITFVQESIHAEETILKGVDRMLDQLSWQQRGRTECTCGQTTLFACSDCGVPNLCQGCIVVTHKGLPFHSIRVSSTISFCSIHL
jgi:hypothetical protein